MLAEQHTLAARVSAWRETSGQNLKDAAARVGCGFSTLASWERGEALPTNLAVSGLALALGMPVDDLRALIQAERDERAAAKAKAQPQQVAS
jgi:transcriptional regulator with XRE-family HTH domain